MTKPILLLTPFATVLSITSAQAVDYSFGPGVTENFTISATDQARGIGTGTGAGSGFNDGGWGSVYDRGGNRDTTYHHFNLGTLAAGTINGSVNISWVIDASFGGAINGGIVGTANGAWTFPGTTPGLTAISGADPSGNYSHGQTATAVIDNATFQGFINNPSTFYGLGITAGGSSGAHFNGPAVLTGNATTGTVTVGGASDWSLAVWNSGTSTLAISGSDTVSGGDVVVRTGATVSFGSSANMSLSGRISGAGAIAKSGAGTLTLSGNNGYSGGTTVTGGILQAGSSSAFGATGSTVAVNSGGTIDIGGQTLQGYTQNISIAGAGASPTLGALGNSGGLNLNAIRGITLTGNASIGGDAGRWDIGRLDFVADPNNTVNHIDGGGFVLTKVGSGAIGLLTGATNLAGFNMNGGLIQPHENTSFGAGPVTLNSGTIQPWGGVTMVNNFIINGGTMQTEGNFNDTYNGTFALNAASTFNTPGGSITLNGNVSGNADVLKSGGGTLVFNGNNTQTGKLTVAGGHVRFGSTAGQATLGNVEMTNPGSFLLMAAPNQFGPTSTLKFNSPGHSEFALYGHNQTIASLESTNQFAVVQNSHSSFGNAAASSTLTVNQNTDTTYSGYVRNNTGNDAFTLSLTKSGTGRLTLEGPNITYTGATNINGGTLRIAGTATGSAYNINNGGTLEGTGSIVTTNQNVTLNAGGKLSPGASPGTLTINVGSGQLDLTGGIAGSATNSLLWEIDSNPAATDLIALTGTLNIGAGLLEWDDFAFTTGSLSNGVITLIDSNLSISGSLGANVSGALPGGYTGTLSLGDSNTSLIMTVVPEPSAILLASLAGLGLLRRRRA